MKWIKVRSVKTKLLLGFSGIFLVLFSVLFGLNQLYADDFFLYVNSRRMASESAKVVKKDDGFDYARYLRDISRDSGGMAVIFDENHKLIVAESLDLGIDRMPDDHFYELIALVEESNDKTYFQVVGNSDSLDRKLIFVRGLSDGNYLFISKGLGIVHEVQKMFVTFLGIASLFVYMLGFILIYMFAEQFTKPIITLESATRRMAELDFSGRITDHSDDEVGKLVKSVNSMALALSVSIEDLNASNALLEKELSKERDLEKMRRRFVTDVSHELKNPISMIIGYADGIERGLTKTDEDRKYYAHVIKDEGNRMNRLVSDLLDLSSYSSGTFRMNMVEMDLTDLLQTILIRYQHIGEEKNVAMTYTGENKVRMVGDELRLEQVLLNLLDNAFKHVEEGGKIIADLRKAQEGITLRLSNTGDMIPEEELENIWNSFYQVDTDAAGNGLGLAIVRSIVEMHKGQTGVYVQGGMNHFEIRLP